MFSSALGLHETVAINARMHSSGLIGRRSSSACLWKQLVVVVALAIVALTLGTVMWKTYRGPMVSKEVARNGAVAWQRS